MKYGNSHASAIYKWLLLLLLLSLLKELFSVQLKTSLKAGMQFISGKLTNVSAVKTNKQKQQQQQNCNKVVASGILCIQSARRVNCHCHFIGAVQSNRKLGVVPLKRLVLILHYFISLHCNAVMSISKHVSQPVPCLILLYR